jgi:hypothetical protein
MSVFRGKPLTAKQKHEKALKALKKAGTDEIKIMQFPDGSMLIKLTPHDGSKKKALPEINAEKQRYLLDSIPDEQAKEDSEEWINKIHSDQ